MDTLSNGLFPRLVSATLGCCILFAASPFAAAEPLPIQNGDRIVLVGPTFIERDVRYGCIETLITAQFPDLDLSFRNLGWSGDDVFGIARASFDAPAMGYERLVNQIKDAAPTVLLMAYGLNESFNGPDGLDEFIDGYSKLLDDVAPLNAKTVLISPTLQADMGAPLPDPSEHNINIRLYTKAIAKLAGERDLRFIDMTTALSFPVEFPKGHWTDNGVHFTEAGYWRIASTLLKELGYPPASFTSETLAPLQHVVNEKNRLFFLKWRPQNETYITGFRKYEQGRHVAEIPLFDPLVVEQEAKIRELRNALSQEGPGE